MPESLWSWGAGIAELLAALVGMYFASRLNRLTRGGVIGSSVGLVIFGFSILAITALFDVFLPFVQALLPYAPSELTLAKELLRLLAMLFLAVYFYRVYKGFAGYAARGKTSSADDVDEHVAALIGDGDTPS